MKTRRRKGRESAATRAARAQVIFQRLHQAYPDAACALDHADAYQLLVATILSAQCTDARVNMVTPAFFARYPTPEDLARADRHRDVAHDVSIAARGPQVDALGGEQRGHPTRLQSSHRK